MANQPRIGYLIPASSQDIAGALVGEIQGLPRAGLRVSLLTLERCRARARLIESSEVDATVDRLTATSLSDRLIGPATHIRALWAAPRPYMRLLRDDVLKPLGCAARKPLLKSEWRKVRARLGLFWAAPRLAYWVTTASVVHLHAHSAEEPLEMAARIRWLTGASYSFGVVTEELQSSSRQRLSRRLAKAKFALTPTEHAHRRLRDLAEKKDRKKVILAPAHDPELYIQVVAPLLQRRLKKARGSTKGRFHPPVIDTSTKIAQARRLLGRSPRLQPDLEQAISRSVLSGLRANSWRRDIDTLAERRLWDELTKVRRAKQLRSLASRFGIALGESSRVLDVGCGRGGLTVALASKDVSTVSLDLRLSNCRVTRLRGQRYDLSLPAAAGRGEALPFADGTFDVVSLLEVLEHVANPAALLEEAQRVCHPEGVCVVTVVNRWAHFDPHYHLWGINFLPRRLAEIIISLRGRSKSSHGDNQRLSDLHYFTFDGFKRIAASAGFVVHDPAVPVRRVARFFYLLTRRLSLGFNSTTLLLQLMGQSTAESETAETLAAATARARTRSKHRETHREKPTALIRRPRGRPLRLVSRTDPEGNTWRSRARATTKA